MVPLSATQAHVADDVVLDGRLALFHETERWLAVADLHFGYEISQRAAGWLLPVWGMESVEKRLSELIEEYRPVRLLIVGDLVHDRAAVTAAREFLERLRAQCEVIAVAGNHDRRLGGEIRFLDSWQSDHFYFHHGHCAAESAGKIQIIGHHHPAATLRDGAGLQMKLPAFVQAGSCWILPAFSPWSAGTTWRRETEDRVWVCSPTRVFEMPARASASV